MIKHILASAVSAILMLPLSAQAATSVYSFNLSSAQEVPTNLSTAAGSFQLTVDDVANTLGFVLTAFNLQGGAVTGAHIHNAPVGVNGGVVFNLINNADFTGPVTVGAFQIPNSYALVGSNKAAGVTLADMINAEPWKFYVNLHTTNLPGGEIRGQVSPVPEASTFAMMALGLSVVGLIARRRRAEKL